MKDYEINYHNEYSSVDSLNAEIVALNTELKGFKNTNKKMVLQNTINTSAIVFVSFIAIVLLGIIKFKK